MRAVIVLILAMWIALIAWATRGEAQETDRWRSNLTIVEMIETPDGAAVTFRNSNSDPTADHEFTLSVGGLEVGVFLELGRGASADTMIVDAPEGWIAIPRTLTIPDNTSKSVIVIPLDANMM